MTSATSISLRRAATGNYPLRNGPPLSYCSAGRNTRCDYLAPLNFRRTSHNAALAVLSFQHEFRIEWGISLHGDFLINVGSSGFYLHSCFEAFFAITVPPISAGPVIT